MVRFGHVIYAITSTRPDAWRLYREATPIVLTCEPMPDDRQKIIDRANRMVVQSRTLRRLADELLQESHDLKASAKPDGHAAKALKSAKKR